MKNLKIAVLLLAGGHLAEAAPLRTFTLDCLNQNLDVEDRHTIEVLLEKAGTVKCAEAEKVLKTFDALDLSARRIHSVAPLRFFPQLRRLWLNDNYLDDLEPLATITSLNRIELKRAKLFDVESLGKVSNLKVISLDGNRLLPSQIHRLRAKLPTAFITAGPQVGLQQICEEPNLTGADANFLELLKSSFKVSECSELAGIASVAEKLSLNLGESALTPGSFLRFHFLRYFPQVKEIQLQGTKPNDEFTDMSEMDLRPFRDLSALRLIILSGVRISSSAVASKLFSGLNHIEALYLMDGSLGGLLEEALFAEMTNLQDLRIYEMEVSGSLPEGLFSSLTQLKTVALSGNLVSGSIPPGLFKNLKHLEEIRLYRNELRGLIPDRLFAGLSALREIDFSNNDLSGDIPEKIFSDSPKLVRVDWGNNPRLKLRAPLFVDFSLPLPRPEKPVPFPTPPPLGESCRHVLRGSRSDPTEVLVCLPTDFSGRRSPPPPMP